MSFATDINAVMIADTSLNGLVDGGIHYENLLDNWLGDTDDEAWIVYEFDKDQVDCINSKNVYVNYTLRAVVIQRNSNDAIDTISNRLITYLNNYGSGSIIDIGFSNDQHGFTQQKGIYTNVLEFNCIYVET